MEPLTIAFPRLAFVDVETTGVDPQTCRITELAIVTVDGDRIQEWSTLINPFGRTASMRREIASDAVDAVDGASAGRPWPTRTSAPITSGALHDAPRFVDVASEVARRLDGRLFIAHNARFDYTFIKAEFARLGRVFDPKILCSLMLSRHLYAEYSHHDLDTLAERHGLTVDVRHRALPDARLLHEFWQVIHREHALSEIDRTVAALVAGPLLPAHLDPQLIEKLPDKPGIYTLHDENSNALCTGAAANLRLRVLNYFRVGRMSATACAISHRIADVSWQVTQGLLGAQLRLSSIAGDSSPSRRSSAPEALCSWKLVPDAYPSVALMSWPNRDASDREESFGLFTSERKARNSLIRLAARHSLCHSALGIVESESAECPACADRSPAARCAGKSDRLRQRIRLFEALRSLRVPQWPFPGPVGIRERSDMHIVDNWQYLGTAKHDSEIDSVLEIKRGAFDMKVFALLLKTLPSLPYQRIVSLHVERRLAAEPSPSDRDWETA